MPLASDRSTRAMEGEALETAPHLGFLAILQENGSYLGGYLVTSSWGRPLEFRLSSAVQPNRVQQILYGPTLKPYVCADLIGKTLVEKCGVAPHVVLTDCEHALDLRLSVAFPVVWLAPLADAAGQALAANGLEARQGQGYRGVCHPKFPDDVKAVQTLLEKVDAAADLTEPYLRIREALAEARKMGATSRAA
jgi:hypothetical protein